uniref:G_PROTEIN_RECEP_F1_2 domain-containing protein n=1 Tax=Caenorhabditis japonica TaxID=281687 RepID=A0A8R1DTC4_CAEJA
MTDPSDFIPPAWPLLVYFGMSIVSLPLYFFVFVSLLRLRCFSKAYNTTFYSILLQHCIADLLAMFLFFTTNSARNAHFLRDFYFEYQHYYIAAASYNAIYYTLYIRCTGIVFLSVQRYLIITHPTSVVTHKVQNASTLEIVIVYWSVPTLLSLVVLKDTDFSFDSVETMAIIADQSVIKRNTLMALIVVSTACLICSLAYGALFVFIRRHSASLSR